MDDKKLFDALYEKCLRYLTIRPRCEKEIRLYLTRKTKEDSESIIEKIIDQLKEEKEINDDAFVTWWVEQRSYFKPKGRSILTSELLQKGVRREVIDAYFEEIPFDETKLATEALLSKTKRFVRLPQKERFEKSMKFLASRGFSWEAAKKAFEESEMMK